MKRTLQAVEVVTPERAAERALPEEVQVSLAEIAGAAREGLLALAVGTGLAVLQEAMEHEVSELAGARGRDDRERVAYRHGHTGGEVSLGGRRVGVERPRVRAGDGSGELGLASYRHFAAEDPLSRVVLERMLAGVSTRRYARTQEPVGERVEAAARSTSKSAVSRRVVARTREALEELMSRRLDELELAALMIDGLDLDERCNVVALGITRDGTKVPLGLWEGSTENATVASALLADLQDRGLDIMPHPPAGGSMPTCRSTCAHRPCRSPVVGVHGVYGAAAPTRSRPGPARHLRPRDGPPQLVAAPAWARGLRGSAMAFPCPNAE